MRGTDSYRLNYDQSERFFQDENVWYSHTREGNRGPFNCLTAAETELADYIDAMSFIEANKSFLPTDLDVANVTVVELGSPAAF